MVRRTPVREGVKAMVTVEGDQLFDLVANRQGAI